MIFNKLEPLLYKGSSLFYLLLIDELSDVEVVKRGN